MLGRAKNGIDRAGLNTLGTTNAFVLSNIGDLSYALLTVFLIEGNSLYVEQVG